MGDYDFEPREAPSVFLTLKNKGDKVLVRLASSPYREPKVWKTDSKEPPMADENVLKLSEDHWRTIYRDPQYTVSEVFHWKVIDRETGLARIYSGTAGVYKQIKKYATMQGWGDPMGYDFQIERTEQPGPSYYQVTAIPDKTPIGETEQKLIDAIDMTEKKPVARKLSEIQVDYIPEMGNPTDGVDPVPAEDADQSPKPNQKDDVVIEDIGDEPINLDDIPF